MLNKIKRALSYRAAKGIMKDRAVNFYHAFSKMPPRRFDAIPAIYAYCRYVDDIVDKIGIDKTALEAFRMLDKVEEDIDTLYDASNFERFQAGGSEKQSLMNSFRTHYNSSNLNWWMAFCDTIMNFEISQSSLLSQIEGQRRDGDFKDIQSVEELIDYSKLVAGSVGLMLAPIIAKDSDIAKDETFLKSCENLGVGMQISNILRDVGEDFRLRNRVYLPAELMRKHGVSRRDIEEFSVGKKDIRDGSGKSEEFIKLWEQISEIGEQYYSEYEGMVEKFHESCKLSIIAAGRIYHSIEDAVRENAYDCFTKRCYTDELTRKKIILESMKWVNSK